MNISVEIAWLESVMLASIRVGAVFLLTPILAITKAPVQFRVYFVIALATVIISAFAVPPVNAGIALAELTYAAIHELLIGSLMAFGIFAAFGAFLLGGRILDFQMGFGVANLIDPATDTQTAMMGVILNLIAVMLFFLVDGHHMIIRGLAYSFKLLPIGSSVNEINLGAIVSQFGMMFTFGVMLVAPAIFSILLLDVGLGVVARTMPQVNVFFVSIPLKVFVGLTVTAISLSNMTPMVEMVFESIFSYWQEVLG